MKKLIALILSVIICAALFSSCGEEKKSKSSSKVSETQSDEVTVDSVEKVKQISLVSEKGITIATQNLGQTESDGKITYKALYLDVRNNSDKDIDIALTQSSVNDYMIPVDVVGSVGAGERKTIAASFDDTKLRNSGITTFAKMVFCVSVADSDSGDEIITTKPIEVKTSEFDSYEYNFDESGTSAYSGNDIEIIIKDVYTDDEAGQCVKVYVSNLSERNIAVSITGSTVNGKKVEALFCSDVLAGKHDVSTIVFEQSDGISIVHKLKTSFVINDYDSGKVIVKKTDPVTVDFDADEE